MANTDGELFRDKIEISLDGRQVFYLFFGGALIASLVFVLGVMVGRRVEARTLAEEASVESDPLAALDRLESRGTLAFPSALRGDDAPLGSFEEGLRPQPLLATGGPVGQDQGAKGQAAGGEADAEAKSEPAQPAEPEGAVGQDAEDKAAVSKKAEGAEEEAASPPKAKSKRRFTLQVGSFQDKLEADSFFRLIEGAGYKPYLVEAEVPGKGKHYRVRIGGYASFDEAVAAKAGFEETQHVIAYVTRLR